MPDAEFVPGFDLRSHDVVRGLLPDPRIEAKVESVRAGSTPDRLLVRCGWVEGGVRVFASRDVSAWQPYALVARAGASR